MNLKSAVFRLRSLIFLAIYLLGFLAPWDRLFTSYPSGRLWLAASALAARTGWMRIAASTRMVTLAALCCCVAGAALRVWGTAYLGGGVTRDSALRGDRLIAAGPYRHVRNPLYVGGWIFSLGVSILMPPSGALFFLAAVALFQWSLISGEEEFLKLRLGDTYGEYLQRVPRLLPSLVAKVPPSAARPRWAQAVLAEIYPVGYALCFAILAWRYNALILIQSLVICYGISIVARAAWPPSHSRPS